MDSEKLAQMVEHIQQEKLGIHSLMIVRNGYLVSEFYAYPYSAGQAHSVMSVTKSVISALVGIAIHKGYIKDVHQPLFDFLPDLEVANFDDKKKAITLEELLTMTSGLDCHENPASGEPYMQASQDWVQFMLDLPMAEQPGTRFNYCTGAIELLSAVIEKATGMNTRKFANENLFTPIGIGPVTENRWPSDPQGVTIGGFGLALTPLEMAKFGLLFLNQGQWEGKTVIPASWVTASTTSHANKGDKKEYGYLWWIDPQAKWYAALGRSGQHIFIYPAQNMVVVFTAGLPYTNDADLIPLQNLLDRYILPSLKSDRSLSANPDGYALLEATTQALARPQRTVPPALPAAANEISGKVYTLEDNPFGWHSMIFNFPLAADEARITVDGMREFTIGLDNVYRIYSIDDKTFPQAFRGHWENQDTFLVDDLVLGQFMQVISRIQFSGTAININWNEINSGNVVEIKGQQQQVTK
jgi:CubicO group peptidase (beta-lactamase class C family)